jgi:serpin B
MGLSARLPIAATLAAALVASACATPEDATPTTTPAPTATPTAASTPSAPTPTPRSTQTGGGGLQQPAVDARVANAYTAFGLDLFKRLSAMDKGKNVFVSPSSVAFALSMTYNGAAGATQQEMASALHFEGLTLQHNEQSYDAEVTTLDFSRPDAAPTINRWVSDNTRGKIPEIVQAPIDPQSILFLINAVYFNGKWTKPFDPKRTAAGPFTRADGSSVTVPMMSQDMSVRMLQGQGFQAIALPYGESRMRMYFFLPDGPADAFVQGLNQKDWDSWMQGFRDGRAVVSIPKFTTRYEATLNDSLKAMGMPAAFDPGRADLTGIASRESLGGQNAYINSVKHKTFLSVSEEGTEAAGATSVEVGIRSMPPMFTVDRPFVTAIVDSATGTVLFLGVINDPSA